MRRKADAMKNMRIVQKMALGYLMLVLLPILVFGVYLYNQFYMDVISEYSEGKQELVLQAGEGFRGRLKQIESIHSQFQYNQQLIDYLGGMYPSELNQVYTYLKDIRPIYIYAITGNKEVASIKLYKNQQSVQSVAGELEDLSQIDAKAIELLNAVNVDKGVWLHASNLAGKEGAGLPYLSYYQRIFNNSYTQSLAEMVINVDDSLVSNLLKAIDVDQKTHVQIIYNGATVYRGGYDLSPEQTAEMQALADASEKGFAYSRSQKLLVNSLSVPELSTSFYFYSQMDDVFVDIRKKAVFLGISLLVSLLILTGIYYATASTIVRRILGLAKHMRKVDENKLTYYEGGSSRDEIDFLTRSYNSLIRRIDELLTNVHKAELMKKEADYLVLQAQIKPHFLYNTLESIRMLAEINDDQEVVDATFTFGKLLRYTLTSKDNETMLQHELTNVQHYLDMHKLRLLDRFQYSIEVLTPIDNVRCPRFILQPLVENCIHHGVGSSRRNGRIDIEVKREDDTLIIVIADNGPGIPSERLDVIRGVLGNVLDRQELQKENSGQGLYNVSERIRIFYGDHSALMVESQAGEGTMFTLKLKVQGGI
ncbi:sensor histidine kinase [Paenibacillus sp. YIM B09110]|uniref:sensor histidine kinase n=1 Tax=Paenibacillus sp. YIM B09110 TaxID=3126102 RepID=UPI00301E3CE9